MRVGWIALASLTVCIGVACDLGLSESDIRSSSGTSTGADGGGGAGGETSTSTGTGTGGVGGAATECWDQPVTAWTVSAIDTSLLTGLNPGHLSISPDALSATYDAGPVDGRRAYVVTRSDRTGSFKEGTQLASWPSVSGDVRHPVLTSADVELYFENQGDILRSIAVTGGGGGAGGAGGTGGVGLQGGAGGVGGAGVTWSDPTRVLPLSDVATEGFPSLTADGLRMVFYRKLIAGPPHLVEAARATAADSFIEQPVEIPNLTADDEARCPVLSPDGLVLFFASSFGEAPTMDNTNTKWKVLATTRSTLAGAWTDAIEIADLDHETLAVCPSAVSADGCGLSFFHYDFGAAVTSAEGLASRSLASP